MATAVEDAMGAAEEEVAGEAGELAEAVVDFEDEAAVVGDGNGSEVSEGLLQAVGCGTSLEQLRRWRRRDGLWRGLGWGWRSRGGGAEGGKPPDEEAAGGGDQGEAAGEAQCGGAQSEGALCGGLGELLKLCGLKLVEIDERGVGGGGRGVAGGGRWRAVAAGAVAGCLDGIEGDQIAASDGDGWRLVGRSGADRRSHAPE
jgi:hypothetical protein